MVVHRLSWDGSSVCGVLRLVTGNVVLLELFLLVVGVVTVGVLLPLLVIVHVVPLVLKLLTYPLGTDGSLTVHL